MELLQVEPFGPTNIGKVKFVSVKCTWNARPTVNLVTELCSGLRYNPRNLPNSKNSELIHYRKANREMETAKHFAGCTFVDSDMNYRWKRAQWWGLESLKITITAWLTHIILLFDMWKFVRDCSRPSLSAIRLPYPVQISARSIAHDSR